MLWLTWPPDPPTSSTSGEGPTETDNDLTRPRSLSLLPPIPLPPQNAERSLGVSTVLPLPVVRGGCSGQAQDVGAKVLATEHLGAGPLVPAGAQCPCAGLSRYPCPGGNLSAPSPHPTMPPTRGVPSHHAHRARGFCTHLTRQSSGSRSAARPAQGVGKGRRWHGAPLGRRARRRAAPASCGERSAGRPGTWAG